MAGTTKTNEADSARVSGLRGEAVGESIQRE